jgi:hypothetical protein
VRFSERWPTATTVGNHLIILELELIATLVVTLTSSASNSHFEFDFANRTCGLVPLHRFLARRVPVLKIQSGIVGKSASC